MTLPPLKVVFFLGPRGAGKSSAALLVAENGSGGPYVLDGFDVEVRERCHAAYKIIDTETRLPAPAHHFEASLDQPHEAFDGMSPRNAYLKFRRWVNDAFPTGTPGRWLAQRARFFQDLQAKRRPADQRVRTLLVHDEGTPADYGEAIKLFAVENCLAVQVVGQHQLAAWAPSIEGLTPVAVKNLKTDLPSLRAALGAAVPSLFLHTTPTPQ